MSNAAINTAMIAHLKLLALSPELPIVENVEDEYKPTIGGEYLECRYFPAPTNTLWVRGGRAEYTGFLQVTVVFPRNSGVTEAMTIADAIIEHFKENSILDGDGVRVKINRRPSQATPTPDGAWLRVPVSINYHCMA